MDRLVLIWLLIVGRLGALVWSVELLEWLIMFFVGFPFVFDVVATLWFLSLVLLFIHSIF